MFKEIFSAFSNRMESFLIYQPILDLAQKERYKQYPLVSIGMAILLFILENMLRNEQHNTYEDIARFLQDLLREKYNEELSFSESYDMTLVIVREYLRNNGEPFQMAYFDFETKEQKTKYFHLIDFTSTYNLQDIKDKKASFRLTPEAIESLFKTREIFQEMQITIVQLYFRQQIQRKVFDGALHTIEELIFAITNEKVRMNRLIERILKNVLEIARENEFEGMMERYETRLLQENQQFTEINELISYTIDQYHNQEMTEKEEKAIRLIRKVQQRWREALTLHEELFSLKQEVQKFFFDSMESIIFQAFQTNINFEKEVLPFVIEKKMTLDGLRTILQPLNTWKSLRLFHPGIFFEPQKHRRESTPKETVLPELTEEERIRIEAEERQQKHMRLNLMKEMVAFLFSPLLTLDCYRMGEYLKKEQPLWVKDPLFYTLVIQFHQLKNVSFEIIDEDKLFALDDIRRSIAEYSRESGIGKVVKNAHFNVILGEAIHFANGLREISDFYVERGEKR